MKFISHPLISDGIIYPDSDGEPMSDNTRQYEWIVTIKEGIDALFRDRPDVFVAGNLLWYPVKGHPEIRRGPDTLVVFGRPKGHRGSYRQWEEDNIPPQVVVEVLSPGNTPDEMGKKFVFYEQYGVEEYYIYDPDDNTLNGWVRQGARLQEIVQMNRWTSPLLGIQFLLTPETLHIYRPDGHRFLTYDEADRQREWAEQQVKNVEDLLDQERWEKGLAQRRTEQAQLRAEQEREEKEQAQLRAEQERERAEQEREEKEQAQLRAEQERERAEQEREEKEQAQLRAEQEREEKEQTQLRAERLPQRLREMGIDPEQC